MSQYLEKGRGTKFVHEEVLIDAGGFRQSAEFVRAHRDVIDAIAKVVWPPDEAAFTIYPASAVERHPNGVVPIKAAFQKHLRDSGWELEYTLDFGLTRRRPGPLDAVLRFVTVSPDPGTRFFGVEWETGNISSSHRALGKMAIGLYKALLVGAALVLPSDRLYPHLTDRIGRYGELEPYFDLYRLIPVTYGTLSVIAVEQDGESTSVARIPKGVDGNAFRRRLLG